jgi:hypothetical protein
METPSKTKGLPVDGQHRIIRVFPDATKATPVDADAFSGLPPLWWSPPPDAAEIHVSVTFTWDRRRAEKMADECRWRYPYIPVKVGGPAYGDAGGNFTPGLYLADGYVITSRGCPNHCPNCLVPTREGPLRTLPIMHGYDVLDNNFLACPQPHIAAVLDMLRRNGRDQRPRFTGGLQASLFTEDVAREILSVKPDVMFFAFDRLSETYEVERSILTVRELTKWSKGTMRNRVGCYVLCGHDGDTIEDAEKRIQFIIKTGARAYPMFYRGEDYNHTPQDWRDMIGRVLTFGGG